MKKATIFTAILVAAAAITADQIWNNVYTAIAMFVSISVAGVLAAIDLFKRK